MLYFFSGFLIALLFAGLVLMLTYFRFKKIREKQSRIKGYLDLIPDLTQDQREQVAMIRKSFLPKVEGIRRNLYVRRAELAELLSAEPADRSEIAEVSQQILYHQTELETEVIAHILEEKELLSPMQKRKFYEIIVREFSSGGLGVHDVRAGRK